MGGDTARRGFQYQDRYLLLQLLKEAATSLKDGRAQKRFGVEAQTPQDAGSSPAWDVIIQDGFLYDVVEVKSGSVERLDRLVFWRRLRTEATSARRKSIIIRPLVVLDPSASSVDSWLSIPEIVNFNKLPDRAPRRVTSPTELVAEALWFLCCDGTTRDLLLSYAEAVELLRSLRVELFESKILEKAVTNGIDAIFSDGLSDQTEDLLLGWLNSRAISGTKERRYLTFAELLSEVGIFKESHALDAGLMRKWRDLAEDLQAKFNSRCAAGLGEEKCIVSFVRAQPQLSVHLHNHEVGGLVILGMAGCGKTKLLWQIAEQYKDKGDFVAPCAADDLNGEEIEGYVRWLRFQRAVINLEGANHRLVILLDALDEAEPELRKRWGQLLSRIAMHERIIVITTIREEVWRADGVTRPQLLGWEVCSAVSWSVDLVKELLADASFSSQLSPGLIELVRTPLMLDIFWRVFLDVDASSERIGLPHTRHQLLEAFWLRRFLNSPRSEAHVIKEQIDSLLQILASETSGISERLTFNCALAAMRSESILVPNGGVHTRFRFRHPLLRDFILSWWCLSCTSSEEACTRWQSIRGGLQRHGALRAIFDALSDDEFRSHHSHAQSQSFLASVLATSIDAASSVAHLLGTNDASPLLDPAHWPYSLQKTLPAHFGREILSITLVAGNQSWCVPVSNWPLEATWIDPEFADALCDTVAFLKNRIRERPNDADLRNRARKVAVHLRRASEHSRFNDIFARNDRLLTARAQIALISIVPDVQTLAWCEREMARSTWRTRGRLFEDLIHLAAVDAFRAASLYRTAAGLKFEDGKWRADKEFGGAMDHQAIEWSLAGKDGNRSLLHEFPHAFMSVAFQLIDGLRALSEFGFDTFDEHLSWQFWEGHASMSQLLRVMDAVHSASKTLATERPEEFFEFVAPLFQSTKSVMLMSIYLDALFTNVTEFQSLRALDDVLVDGRVYHFTQLYHWLESALEIRWTSLQPNQKAIVLENIEALPQSTTCNGASCRRRFLALIPQSDLSITQAADARQCIEQGMKRTNHPKSRESEMAYFEDDVVSEAENQVAIGWPEEFQEPAITILKKARSKFAENMDAGARIELLQKISETLLLIIDKLSKYVFFLIADEQDWFWDLLSEFLEKYRVWIDDQPDPRIIEACASISLEALERIPHEIPADRLDCWPSTPWMRALKLADTALTWSPSRDDSSLQGRWVSIIQRTFREDNPTLHVAFLSNVRNWHWLRTSERQRETTLILEKAKNGGVLRSFLRIIFSQPDMHRTIVLEGMLKRSDISESVEFMDQFGRGIGYNALHEFNDIGRSAISELLRDILADIDKFKLLTSLTMRAAFLHGVSFGLKEKAKTNVKSCDLASDFGVWNLRIWQLLGPMRIKRMGSKDVVLFAIHWLERKDAQFINYLKIWWANIIVLLRAIVVSGERPDCYILFFQFRDGAFNHLMAASELFELIEVLTDRLAFLSLGEIEFIDHKNEEFHSWQEVMNYAASAIESARVATLFASDIERERAGNLLSKLAGPPFNAYSAKIGLHKLQTDYL